MTGDRNPWSDPDAPTDPGTVYGGPPATDRPAPGYGPPSGYGVPPGYGPPGYGPQPGFGAPPGYGPQPGYGVPPGYGPQPGYGVPPGYGYLPPRGPKRPGQVITAAVLAFVQAALVMLASFYVIFFASVVDLAASDASVPAGVDGLATEGRVVGIVQLLSVVVLIVGGVMALNTRRRSAFLVLLAGLAVQVVLAVYWFIRISSVADGIPGPDPTGAFLAVTLLFAAGPLVGLGLLLLGPARPWFGVVPAKGAGTLPQPPAH